MPQELEGLKAVNALTSQIVTVCSALLGFTVTFVGQFTPKNEVPVAPLALKLAWMGLVLTIVFGFWVQSAAAGSLFEMDQNKSGSNSHLSNVKIPSTLMMLLFILSLSLLVAAGWNLSM